MPESLLKTIKVEGVYPTAFETFADVAEHLPRFIDKYNEPRLHSALGFRSPARFEQETPRLRSNQRPDPCPARVGRAQARVLKLRLSFPVSRAHNCCASGPSDNVARSCGWGGRGGTQPRVAPPD